MFPRHSTVASSPLLVNSNDTPLAAIPKVAQASFQEALLEGYARSKVASPTTGLLTGARRMSNGTKPSQQLLLEDAIRLGLESNPDLMTVRETSSVARAAAQVANVYPYNPQFQTQVLPYSRDKNGADGAVSQQHVILQTFERGGQQRFRERAAAANVNQVSNTIQQAELTNVAQTTRLFFATQYQRELYELNLELADLNEQLIGVMERREKAGLANNSDVSLAKIQAQASRRQQRIAESTFQTASRALRTQLNLDTDAPLELDRQWADLAWQPLDNALGYDSAPRVSRVTIDDEFELPVAYDDQVIRQLIDQRPDIQAARSAVSVASENLRLANAMQRPSLQVGPMYQRDDSSTTFWGFQGQFDIPVVNTGKPLVNQRKAELRLQQVTATQIENKAILEAKAAILRYERARQLLEKSKADFDIDVTELLQPFEDQFKAGQITLLQVFAARTAVTQARQSHFELINEVCVAAADVTQATGLKPQQLIAR